MAPTSGGARRHRHRSNTDSRSVLAIRRMRLNPLRTVGDEAFNNARDIDSAL